MEMYIKLLVVTNILALLTIWYCTFFLLKCFRNEFKHTRNINRIQARNFAIMLSNKELDLATKIENSEKRIRKEMNK